MIPRARRSPDDIKRDLSRAVDHRGQKRSRISELSRQISVLSRDVVSDNRSIDRLLGEPSAAHRAEIEATADRLVQP